MRRTPQLGESPSGSGQGIVCVRRKIRSPFHPAASFPRQSAWPLRPPQRSALASVLSAESEGGFTILRLYGPLEPWFKKTWRPGEIELQP